MTARFFEFDFEVVAFPTGGDVDFEGCMGAVSLEGSGRRVFSVPERSFEVEESALSFPSNSFLDAELDPSKVGVSFRLLVSFDPFDGLGADLE